MFAINPLCNTSLLSLFLFLLFSLYSFFLVKIQWHFLFSLPFFLPLYSLFLYFLSVTFMHFLLLFLFFLFFCCVLSTLLYATPILTVDSLFYVLIQLLFLFIFFFFYFVFLFILLSILPVNLYYFCPQNRDILFYSLCFCCLTL